MNKSFRKMNPGNWSRRTWCASILLIGSMGLAGCWPTGSIEENLSPAEWRECAQAVAEQAVRDGRTVETAQDIVRLALPVCGPVGE